MKPSEADKVMAQDDAANWNDDSVLPVSVIIADNRAAGLDRWQVNGIVVGQRFASEEVRCLRLRSGPEGELYMWLGFRLRLQRRCVDDYALNVNAPAPKAFVVGRRDADSFTPLQVTVSLDEAQNLDATDLRGSEDEVFQVPLPPEVFRWLERYVLEHYVPKRRKGRGKRRSKALFDAEVGDYAGDEG